MIVKQFLKVGFLIFFLRVLGAVFQFGFHLLIARKFGLSGFGLFSIAFTLTIIASVFARWGIDQWVLRELSTSLNPDSKRNWFSIFVNGFGFVSVLSALFTITLVASSEFLANIFANNQDHAQILIQIMLASLIPFTLVNFLAEAFRAVNRQLIASILQGVLIPALSISLLFISLQLHLYDYSIVIIAVIYTVACVLAFIVAITMWYALRHKLAPKKKLTWIGSDLIRETTPFALIVIMTTLLGFVDSIFIGFFHEPSEVGLYAASQRVVLLISFIILSLNNLVGPQFAFLNGQKNYKALFELYSSSTRLMIYLMLPLITFLVLFPSLLLSMYGKDFTQATPVFLCLLAGQVINVLTGPVGVLMMMTNHVVELKRFTFLSLIVHITASILLTPYWGARGASIAALVSGSSLNILCWYFVYKMRKSHLITRK